ncbi:MAG: 23S rRNA (pseudouridine(1915)-N(3))-methyltransferase RlmH [Alphaproteobacteria bacterium 64-11]|nr:23S rRNA (pseudouridine(1915)-N(3))-methyltransferase RlmH [Alphaproteobacteria bacterium]OJU14074.1 MAG: 23S rRNA (pseudouridine(1915)-N(3))-methyltransferase RlmH [Alphaproteobacteria bacterium 64-11]
MRLWIFAVGHMRGTPEGQLCDDFVDRARKLGRGLGFTGVTVEELAVSRRREAAARMKDEAERLSHRLPEGAHIVLLDARGKGMTSEDFAEMLGSLRDVGTRNLAFVIGGPDGLAPLPGQKPGRSLAFGPQTWPHLLVRALLAEQVYRAITILAGHPYHRA